MDITSFILGLQKGKSMGGGSSADVRYVTFMNGDVELYKKPVAVGDDCVNVLTKGLIETPTKESTAQYDYSYSGWTLTNGGTANTTSALANVTEDRTVYAAYTSKARTYAVNFYDGDTLLGTKKVAYGTVPSYGTPTKDGYSFDGWQPSLSAVTGEQNYYAQWIEAVTFAGSSWDKIVEIANAGKGADNFSVGDTRTETLHYEDGTSEDITLTIIGFDHDTLYDSEGTANISIISNVLATDRPISATMADGHIWSQSDLRYWLRNTLKNALPTQLSSAIKAVSKTQSGCSKKTNGVKTETTSETIFVLRSSSDCYVSTTRYPIFGSNFGTTLEKYNAYKADGTVAPYWLREGMYSDASAIRWTYREPINEATIYSTQDGTNLCGVRFVFCI